MLTPSDIFVPPTTYIDQTGITESKWFKDTTLEESKLGKVIKVCTNFWTKLNTRHYNYSKREELIQEKASRLDKV